MIRKQKKSNLVAFKICIHIVLYKTEEKKGKKKNILFHFFQKLSYSPARYVCFLSPVWPHGTGNQLGWLHSYVLLHGDFHTVLTLALVVKSLSAKAGDIRGMDSIPGLGRSPGGGHGHPLQYSCLENPMDRGVWRVTVHGVAKCQTPLMT